MVAAAEPTARRGRPQSRRRDRRQTTRLHGDDVELTVDRRAVGAVANAGDRRAAEQTLREAEPGSELEIVARRAHRRGDDRSVELDRQRLFDNDPVRPPRRPPGGVDTRDHHPSHTLTSHDPTLPTAVERERSSRPTRQRGAAGGSGEAITPLNPVAPVTEEMLQRRRPDDEVARPSAASRWGDSKGEGFLPPLGSRSRPYRRHLAWQGRPARACRR